MKIEELCGLYASVESQIRAKETVDKDTVSAIVRALLEQPQLNNELVAVSIFCPYAYHYVAGIYAEPVPEHKPAAHDEPVSVLPEHWDAMTRAVFACAEISVMCAAVEYAEALHFAVADTIRQLSSLRRGILSDLTSGDISDDVRPVRLSALLLLEMLHSKSDSARTLFSAVPVPTSVQLILNEFTVFRDDVPDSELLAYMLRDVRAMSNILTSAYGHESRHNINDVCRREIIATCHRAIAKADCPDNMPAVRNILSIALTAADADPLLGQALLERVHTITNIMKPVENH